MSGLVDGWNRARLRKQAGTVYVTRPNTVMRDVVVGRVVVQAPGFRAYNVLGVGGASMTANHGIFDFTHQAAQGVLENCEVLPDIPSLWVTGVQGHDYTARGVKLHQVTDGFGVYDTKRKSDPVNVTIDDCDVFDLTYFTNDPNHSDRHSHNDAVQIQGGTHITIRNSRLHALVAKTANWKADPYFPAATGQAIAVTPNVSPVGWLHVEGCDLDGGAQSVTLIPGKFGRIADIGSIVNNKFGRNQANVRKGGKRARRPGVAHPDVNVTWRGNTFRDGAPAQLTVTREV